MGEQLSAAMSSGNLDLAEDLARQRLAVATGGPDRMLGNAYRNLGNVLRQKGRLEEAEDMLRKGLPMIEKENGTNSYQAIRALLNLASLMVGQGRYPDAEAVAKEALRRQDAAYPHGIDAIVVRYQLANIERQMERTDLARVLLSEADGLVIDDAPEDKGDSNSGPHWLARRRADTQMQWAHLEYQEGNLVQAAAKARLALDGYSALSEGDSGGRTQAQSLLGSVLVKTGQYVEAEPVLRESLAAALKTLGNGSQETARIQFNLGTVLSRLNRRNESLDALKESVDISRRGGFLSLFAQYARVYANALDRAGRPKEGLALRREAIDAVDRLFAQTRGLDEGTRGNLMQRFGGLYLDTVSALIARHKAEPRAGYDREALATVSRTQSRLFTEMLRQADAGRFARDDAFLALKKRQEEQRLVVAEVRRRLTSLGRDDLGEDNARTGRMDPLILQRTLQRREQVAGELKGALAELDKVDQQLWARYPRYMELTQPRPVTVELLQGTLLKPGETLLSYFLLADRALAFVVSRQQFHMLEIPLGRSEIGSLVAAIRSPEENPGEHFERLSQLDPARLNEAYEKLFRPVEPYLDATHPILIVGDGPLHTLPLELLVTRWGEAERKVFAATRDKAGNPFLGEYGTLSYLGQRYRFSYLPSLSALVSLRQYRKPETTSTLSLVSFADPLFDTAGPLPTTLEYATRNFSRRGGVQIPRLPETADEAREIARILGGRTSVYLRQDAQEYRAKTLDLSTTRFLHFATHGLLGGEYLELNQMLNEDSETVRQRGGPQPVPVAGRGEPALLLSLAGDLRGEDGVLTMHEIVERLDLNTELVVLSACNTAGESGDAASGEGFAGLTRAFMYAGARSLVVSHWSVESAATQRLMVDLFRGLVGGASSLAAIDLARNDLRQSVTVLDGRSVSRAHPFFWAPFVLVGEAPL